MSTDKEKVWKKLSEPLPLFTNLNGEWPLWASGRKITIKEQQDIMQTQKWMMRSTFLKAKPEQE